MNNETNVNVQYVSPLKKILMTIGELPSSYLETMSYYEMLVWFTEFLRNQVIPTVNNNAEAVQELQTLYEELREYVNNYFDNLDVQEEINNKLEEMTEDGSLTQIIKNYVDPIYQEYETTINNAIEGYETTVNSTLDGFQNQINALESGAPIPVSSTSDMTDTSKIYVLTTDGYWYYYDGDSWEQGGVYQSSQSTNDTAGLISLLESKNLYDINSDVAGYVSGTSGVIISAYVPNYERTSDYIPITSSSKVTLISCYENMDTTENEPWQCIGNYNGSKEFISRLAGTNSIKTLSNGKIYNITTFTTPANTSYIRASFRSFINGKLMVLYGDVNDLFKPYELSEKDEKYYINDLIKQKDYNIVVERGFISEATGKNSDTSTNLEKRARSVNYLKLGKGSFIDLTDVAYRQRFRFAVRFYDKNFNYINEVLPWQTERYYITKENCYVRLLFSHYLEAHVLTDDEITMLQNNVIVKNVNDNIAYNGDDSDTQLLKWSNSPLKAINHRGYNTTAPENTIPAFKLSKQFGFDYIECDVQYTSDHVPVILHDETINRTGRNSDGTEISTTTYIRDITYEQALTYDFGIYKGSEWAGTKIPTLEELLTLCRNIGLKVYIELKYNPNENNLAALKNAINKTGMKNEITFISYNHDALTTMKNNYPKNRLGLLRGTPGSDTTDLTFMLTLQTDYNEVFYDISNLPESSYLNSLLSNEIPIELWTLDTESSILNIPDYVSGVTSDSLLANKILYDNFIDLD